MPQQRFGGKGTVAKLRTLGDYLAFYTAALGGKSFRLIYFDAFAGTGEIPLLNELPLLSGTVELSSVIEGSARRALKLEKPFDEYIFVEKLPSRVAHLEKLKLEFPALADRIRIIRADANDAVQEFCSRLRTFDRVVIFLDPFGNQVQWRTIEAIAATSNIDLWYLFPAGLGVVRQITSDGRILADAEDSLDRLFRSTNWRDAVIQKSADADLFGHLEGVNQKVATAENVTRFMIAEMRSIFRGGVLDRWLPVDNRGVHKFSLLFAWSNPSQKARDLAGRVAADIMSRA
jgi:three-Cys-motif partner protein